MRRGPTRRGQVHSAWLAFTASVALLAALIGLLVWNPERREAAGNGPVMIYCAASMRAPLEAIKDEFEKECGVTIVPQYEGSQTLLAKIEVSRQGDLYLPADDSYLDLARSRGLIQETIPLVRMTAVIGVRKGNPAGVHSFEDLLRKDVRLAQARPEATAIGKLSRSSLEKAGRWEELQRRQPVSTETVNEVANAIKVGGVDAGIVWDATVRQYQELEEVRDPVLDRTTAHISVAVLRSAAQPANALRFARYLTARDRGLVEFERQGFRPVDGDAWANVPQLRLYAGAMLGTAIKETLEEFRLREGVEVVVVPNGCGILVAQMRAGERPDAYFACDQSFMTQVSDLFLDAVPVSTNQLVILVPRSNPHGIKSLRDLGKPGLRVGVGHEKQCALGVLTQETLRQGGLLDPVMKNVAKQMPTGDGLVNDLRIGALDAVIAYVSNGAEAPDELTAIKIDVPCAIAVQPIAVGKESQHKQLTSRLVEALRSPVSRQRFEAAGFHWQTAPR